MKLWNSPDLNGDGIAGNKYFLKKIIPEPIHIL